MDRDADRPAQDGWRHAQTPAPRLRRIVFNVEIQGTGPDTTVEANVVLVESRERGTDVWAGRCTYRLRTIDGEWRMAAKKVALVDDARVLPTLAFLI